MGAYGNDNLQFLKQHQYVSYTTVDTSAALDKNTNSVNLYATSDCWVLIGEPGATPVAVKTGAEKTVSQSFFLPATSFLNNIAIPIGSDNATVKISVIQDSAGGDLHIYEFADN